MSWDASLVCNCCGHERDWNYTHNTNLAINEALRATGRQVNESWWRILSGQPADQGAKLLDKIVTELQRDPAKYRAMDPDNGWGSYDSLLPVLVQMRDAGNATMQSRWVVSG